MLAPELERWAELDADLREPMAEISRLVLSGGKRLRPAFCHWGYQAAGGDPSVPITGISLAEAEAYAAWLSQTTGGKYRLPTEAEWEYAANAAGKLPSQSDFNCRVESGGSIIKGLGLVDAQSGKPNGWGLINFVGNAQEWVKTGSGVKTRGGSFEDPLTRCGVNLSEPHSGAADADTGFRLIRELD